MFALSCNLDSNKGLLEIDLIKSSVYVVFCLPNLIGFCKHFLILNAGHVQHVAAGSEIHQTRDENQSMELQHVMMNDF